MLSKNNGTQRLAEWPVRIFPAKMVFGPGDTLSGYIKVEMVGNP